jgi:hypothetical protein
MLYNSDPPTLDKDGNVIAFDQPDDFSMVKCYKGTLSDYDAHKWPTYQTLGTRGDGNFVLNISNIYTNLASQQDMINKNASAATASAATVSGAGILAQQ